MAAEQQRVCCPGEESASGLLLHDVPLTTGSGAILCDISTPFHRPFVTASMRRAVFQTLHGLSHPGIRASQKLLAETFAWHEQLKTVLRAVEDPGNWSDNLHLALVGIRTDLNSDLGCSAAELIFGTTLRLPGEMINLTCRGTDETPDNIVLCDQLQRLFQPPLSIEEAIDQLLRRSLRSDENPRQFADALLWLARDAYPSLSAADGDQVVLDHLKRCLWSQEVTYSMGIQPPGDLNEAIQRAFRMLTTDARRRDNHSRAESWKTTPNRRQQNDASWTRPSTFRTPYRPSPLNTEPRQFRGDRNIDTAAIKNEGCKVISPRPAAWNARILLDNEEIGQPGNGAALVTRELVHHKMGTRYRLKPLLELAHQEQRDGGFEGKNGRGKRQRALDWQLDAEKCWKSLKNKYLF
nr:unnamed protein product [Spirometra erinaceieuropaei]